jgi:erythronate-4-phosphate dehydrogenase
MKIVVDDKIPYIRETLAKLADEVVYLKGSEIKAEDVKDADALIVRTRTHCDERLLKDSKVQFVATATIGYDHLDTTWLEQNGIEWTNCPGCNSGSVAQYIESVLLTLPPSTLHLPPSTLGIVGCGHVGSKVCKVGERLGMRVLVNDPPLEKDIMSKGHHEKNIHHFVSLETIEQEADIITFHVPLNETTHYLADKAFFQRLKKKPVIINSSRGGVVDEQALLQALNDGTVSRAVIDTWENEPNIARTLLYESFIGTPHIAGYSADGKVNADNMVVEALCHHFHLPLPEKIIAPKLPADFKYTGNPLELYNVMNDSEKLKTHPELFEELRGNYPLRREHF